MGCSMVSSCADSHDKSIWQPRLSMSNFFKESLIMVSFSAKSGKTLIFIAPMNKNDQI